MGSNGGAAPNPYRERKASTRFLRVPVGDWPDVKLGRKSEFRRPISNRMAIFGYTPTPVVAYTIRGRTYDHKLMVLTEVRRETLWQIKDQPESLAAEGFETYDAFRTYWRRRTHKYLPLTMVYAYVVRPWVDADQETVGARLIEHLYGEFLP